MKKAEQQTTTFAPAQSAAPAAPPVATMAPAQTFKGRRASDPSSTFRSNRYPVPAVEFRMHPAP